MFDLSDRPLVWIPIKWAVLRPGEAEDDLAVESEAEVDVKVELLDRDDIVSLFGIDLGAPQDEDAADSNISDSEKQLKRFMKVVKDWRKIKNGGKDLKLNKTNADKMLAVPGFATAFVTSYLTACAGKAETRKGN